MWGSRCSGPLGQEKNTSAPLVRVMRCLNAAESLRRAVTEPRIIDAVWEMTNRHLTWPGFSRVKPRKSSIMLLAFLGLGIPAGPDLVELICRRRYATHIAEHVVGYVSFDGRRSMQVTHASKPKIRFTVSPNFEKFNKCYSVRTEKVCICTAVSAASLTRNALAAWPPLAAPFTVTPDATPDLAPKRGNV